MGAKTSIAWTDFTFQPWIGCQRVSPGCTNCYAEAFDKRVGGGTLDDGSKALRWGPYAPRTRTSEAYWRQPLRWNAAAAKAGTRPRVFCASLADVFEDRPEVAAWRLELLDLIASTPHLDWLLLTKRPENLRPMLSECVDLWRSMPGCTDGMELAQAWSNGEAPPNVWLGTTVEDQQRANERIPALLDVPARVRFLSCEPLLEPLTGMAELMRPDAHDDSRRIDWLIIGGESGPKARPFDVAWARSLMRQAAEARTPPAVFVKQLGAAYSDPVDGIAGPGLRVPPEAEALISRRLRARAGEDPAEWPEDLRVREFPEVRP